MQENSDQAPSLFTIALVQVVVGAVLFIALLNGQRDLAILSLLVLGVVIGARLWTVMSTWGLECHLTLDRRRAFPGERLAVTTSAENGKPLPIWIEIRVPIGLLQRSGKSILTKASSLLWFERTQFTWELIAERRGVYPIGPLFVRAGDLFSFFSREKRSGESRALIVYPRLVPVKSFPLPKRDFFGVPRARSPVPDPIYILGTRDYQPGYPSRYIHWKASARHNRLQEKVFEPSVQEKALLVVDVGPFESHGAGEDFERTLELVASVAVRLDRQRHSVGLVSNGSLTGGGPAIVPVARNFQQVPAILETLARLEMKTDRDLRDLLRRSLAGAWGISCAYFSHAEDETVFSAKEFLARRRTPAVFFVCRPPSTAREHGAETQRQIYGLDDIRAAERESV